MEAGCSLLSRSEACRDQGLTAYSQDNYIAVLGTLKSFHDKRSITALTVRPITDFNEIHNHFLRAIYVSLYFRRKLQVSHFPPSSGRLGLYREEPSS